MTRITAQMLAEYADSARQLLGTDPPFDRVALPMLQLRNAHPEALSEYMPAFTGRRQGMRLGAKAAALIARAAIRREKDFYGDPLPASCDILFVSHFVSAAQAASGADNYFGELPAAAVAAGHSVVVAHINHTWLTEKQVMRDWKTTDYPRVILSRTRSALQEMGYQRRLRRAASARSLGSSDLAKHVQDHAFHSAGMFGLRTADQTGAMIQSLRPKVIITTFEGHVWERLLFRIAHNIDPAVLCFGYHHTVLFPQQHALAMRIGAGFDPDHILTTGSVSAEWFSKQQDWANTTVTPLGSVRNTAQTAHPSDGKTCLVTPEGILSESRLLFTAAVEAARLSPHQSFALRLHPVISRADLLRYAPEFTNLPPNVTWSEGPLDAALHQAHSILYRGSTVALSAVPQGVRPIYLRSDNDNFDIDPLAQMPDWHAVVENGAGLAKQLEADAAMDPATKQAAFEAAAAFCTKYFAPLAPQTFLDLIKHDTTEP